LAQEIETRSTEGFSPKARLSDDGQLYWIEQRQGEVVRYDTEPSRIFGSVEPAVRVGVTDRVAIVI